MAADNKSLGKFVLDGIPPAPRGVPQIEVTFDVDSNGVLNVNAKDKATGKEQSIKIEANSGLSEEDIEKMKKEAEEHAGDDEKKKELIDVRNLAEQTIYTAEKALDEHKDALDEAIKTAVTDKITALKKAKDGDDKEAIETATKELGTEMQKIGEAVQKQAEAKDKEDKDKDGDKSDDKSETVRDAEVEEKKDDKDKADGEGK